MRTRAELTQADVARGRYTAAYISALERGLAKPSMAALTFLSERLGVAITDLVAEEPPAAARLEADLLLASGDAERALDAYDTLLDRTGNDRRQQAELLRGRSEALCRLGRGRDAIRPASEAAQLFDELGSPADAAMSRYWLAFAHYQEDNPAEARGILIELLAGDRSGVTVAPDFRFRLLASLGNVEAWDGQTERALDYMEEARSRRGETLRFGSVPRSSRDWRCNTGASATSKRSLRAGQEALALYRGSDAQRDEASLEINIGLVFSQMGSADRSAQHLSRARDTRRGTFTDERLAQTSRKPRHSLALARGDERRRQNARRGRTRREHRRRLVPGGCRRPSHPRPESRVAGIGRLAQRLRTALRPIPSTPTMPSAGAVTCSPNGRLSCTDLGDHADANRLYAEALGRGTGVSAER